MPTHEICYHPMIRLKGICFLKNLEMKKYISTWMAEMEGQVSVLNTKKCFRSICQIKSKVSYNYIKKLKTLHTAFSKEVESNINQNMKSLIPKGAKSTFDENRVIDIRTLFT